MAIQAPPPSPIPPVPSTTLLPSGSASGVSWQWLKWFESLRQRVNSGTGINSINNDTTPAQEIVGGPGVDVSTAKGITTISGTGAAGGILSINADTTAAQQLIAGTNVIIADLGNGQHRISASGGGGGIQSINADTTPAQQIVGSGAITVSTASGITTIGGSGGIASINADTTAAQTMLAGAGISILNNGTGGHTFSAEALDINGPIIFEVNGAFPSYDTTVLVNGS